jgi:hypothetical protein
MSYEEEDTCHLTGYRQVYDESVTESSQLADKVLCM